MTLLEPSVSALPPAARITAGALRVVSRASFPVLLVAVARINDVPFTPLVLGEAIAALVLAPELCARLVLLAFAAEVEVHAGMLRLNGALRRIEAPCAAVANTTAWQIALPLPGISLVLRSGARFPVALAARDPRPLVAAIASAGVPGPPPDDAGLAYARARATRDRRWWSSPLVAIGLASLVPAAIAFNAHQHIAFGGSLGEYHLIGLRAWLSTALLYELTSALYLVLWWGTFSIAVEACSFAGAHASPPRAPRLRRVAERAGAALYYASIPALLALRFLS
jgi:apolipoprotein N-acyltransferase